MNTTTMKNLEKKYIVITKEKSLKEATELFKKHWFKETHDLKRFFWNDYWFCCIIDWEISYAEKLYNFLWDIKELK